MLNLKFHYLSGWEWVVLGGCGVGWSEIEIKANSAKLKLELGLSLATAELGIKYCPPK